MTQTLAFSSGPVKNPQRIVVVGPEGIGKSSLAALFPKPIFIDTEKGTEHLSVDRLDVTSWDALIGAIDALQADPRDYKTVIIDTADAAERLAAAKVLQENKATSIESFGFGKGYVYLAEQWAFLLFKCRELRDIGFNVVFVAHSAIRKMELPDEQGAFDRYVLKLTQTPKNDLSAMLKEWADAVLFLNYRTYVTTDKGGKSKASGGKERTLFTTHTAAWDAKNRWGLPEEIPGKDVAAIYKIIAPHVELQSPPKGVTATPTPNAAPAQAAVTPPPAQPKVQPTNGAFPARLFDAMCLAGIPDDEMKAYLVAKGFIPEGTAVGNLPDNFVSAMLEPENWNKVTAAIAAGRKQ